VEDQGDSVARDSGPVVLEYPRQGVARKRHWRSPDVAAMASWSWGLMVFWPIIGGVIAIMSGVEALLSYATLKPGNRWRAVAGVVLGAVNIGGWMALFWLLGIRRV
jgi:hypothetical protein